MANEVEKQTGADNDGRSPQGQRILRKPTRLERGNPDGFEIRDAGRRENRGYNSWKALDRGDRRRRSRYGQVDVVVQVTSCNVQRTRLGGDRDMDGSQRDRSIEDELIKRSRQWMDG